MTYTVAVTAPSLAPEGLVLLSERGCKVHFVENAADAAGLAHMLTGEPVDAIISRTMHITRPMLESCRTLKVISKHGTGTSNIDMDAATDLGVAVFSTPGANARAVAEFTLALLLASLRHVARFDRAIRAGTWARHGDGLGFQGRRLGLVGYGRIARHVGDMAAALGMAVLAYDPLIPADAPPTGTVELVGSLDEILERSQVLSLHCPAQLGAPPLLDAAKLALLPRGAIVINTARGELIDEGALAAAVESRHLSAAALDTFAIEPLPANSPLRRLDNVILTPHVGGSTPEALGCMARGAAENILEYLDALAQSPGGQVVGRIPDRVRDRCLNLEKLAGIPGDLRRTESLEREGA